MNRTRSGSERRSAPRYLTLGSSLGLGELTLGPIGCRTGAQAGSAAGDLGLGQIKAGSGSG